MIEYIDSRIIASMIGAMATILAVVIGAYLSNKFKERNKAKFILNRSNNELIYGKWVGYYDQKTGKEIFQKKHKVILFFSENIEDYANFYIYGEDKPLEKFYLKNLILENRILKVDYVNMNNQTCHFGTILVEISSNGKILNGKFLGYGIDSERFVIGNFYAEKDMLDRPF